MYQHFDTCCLLFTFMTAPWESACHPRFAGEKLKVEQLSNLHERTSGSQYRFIPNPGLFPKLMLPTTAQPAGGGGRSRGREGQGFHGTHA